MKDCIFCKIIEGEIPSYKIYEDEHTYAFWILRARVGTYACCPQKALA